MHDSQPVHVQPVASLTEFFRDSLHAALGRARVRVDEHTERYVVGVLTLFSRSEALYEPTADGLRIRPLASMLAQALEAPTAGERQRTLQRLGDVSLFVTGFFAQGFARRLISIDYYMAMGARAYTALAGGRARGRRGPLAQVFAELAGKFQPLVDALNEVSEMAYRHSDRDILRLYEQWLRTGSPRAFALLRSRGVLAAPVPRTTQ